MTYRTNRRQFLAGSAAAVAMFPMPAIAQNTPLKIGLLTVKTGRRRRLRAAGREAGRQNGQQDRQDL